MYISIHEVTQKSIFLDFFIICKRFAEKDILLRLLSFSAPEIVMQFFEPVYNFASKIIFDGMLYYETITAAPCGACAWEASPDISQICTVWPDLPPAGGVDQRKSVLNGP